MKLHVTSNTKYPNPIELLTCEWRSELNSRTGSFDLDLFNESADHVYKNGLNDIFTNHTDPVLGFNCNYLIRLQWLQSQL